jgi:hypothetical protein
MAHDLVNTLLKTRKDRRKRLSIQAAGDRQAVKDSSALQLFFADFLSRQCAEED